jgi:hypothetical protein
MDMEAVPVDKEVLGSQIDKAARKVFGEQQLGYVRQDGVPFGEDDAVLE